MKPVIFLAFANTYSEQGQHLQQLKTELEGIRQVLDTAARYNGQFEVVERANASLANVFEVFQRHSGRIAVFHYAGHAGRNELFLEDDQGGTQAAHSAGLVPFLARSRGLQLVFFNGCSSKTQAEQLAAAGVPAVIGTSKPINDAIATRLAIRFYTGVMSGASLRDAWEDAKNELQSSTGNAVTRSLLFGEEGEQDDLIWHVCLRPDADSSEVLNWKFADALRDPLFGLPPIPPQYSFPPEPFRFLRHYEAEHARVFFGRGKAIRDLYRLVDDPEGAPAILLYGQSGVGKSSLLDAGLLPRLEHSHTVRYIRRDQAAGLLRTLAAALGHTSAANPARSREPELEARIAQLREIAAGADPRLRAELDQVIQRLEYQPASLFQQTGAASAAEVQDLRQAWLEAEAQPGGPRPLLIILDQVEEAFTQPMPRNDPADPASPQQELAQLMQAVRQIFGLAERPAGKLILSYRKEYHPEVEDAMRRTQLPYTGVFLQHLDRDDIMEVVRGLAGSERHRRQYRIAIEEHLPEMIANDLQADKKSAISPVLQILMTKLWLETQRSQSGKFSVRQYEALRSQGVLLDDFFRQQMEQLAAMPRFGAAVASGLALDVLFLHTSALGTSRVCTEAEIRERYPSREQEVQALIRQLTDLFLLTGRGGGSTSLAHDTLAPLVQRAFRESDRPGQRATRILESKLDPVDDGQAAAGPNAAAQDSAQLFLDRTDLSIVEAGRSGMRDWNEAEQALYARSSKRRSRQTWTWRAIYALGGLFTLAVVILYLNAEASRIEAENQRMRAQRTSDSLSVTTESLKQTSGELILASQSLSKTNENLKKKQDSLFIAIRLTEKAEREAAQARGKEELAKVLAEQQRDSAQRSARQAQMQSLIADLNRQQALFGEYQAKVRELAVKGLAEKDSALKEQLALTGYHLHRHAVRTVQDTLEVLQRQLEAYRQDSSFVFLAPTMQLAGNLLDDISRRCRLRDAPEEAFAALREAWTRRWMQTGQRLPASSESLVWMGDGSFLYNDRNGALAVAIPPEDIAQGFRRTDRPAQAGYLVKSACATDGGLLLGLDDGRLLPVNSQGSPGRPVQTTLSGPVTALLWEDRLNRVIMASQRSLYRIRLAEPGAAGPQLSELPQPLLPEELRGQFQISSLAMAETPQGMLLLAAGAGPRSGLLLALLLDQESSPAAAVRLPALPGGAAPFRLAWEPRTRQLAVGCMDGRVFLGKLSAAGGWSAWDSLSRVHRSLISGLTFSAGGQRLASASADGQIALYDLLPVPRLALSFRHSSIRPSPVSVLSFDRRAQRLIYGDAYDIYGVPIAPRQLFEDLCSPQTGYLKPVEQALGGIDLPPLCSAQSNP